MILLKIFLLISVLMDVGFFLQKDWYQFIGGLLGTVLLFSIHQGFRNVIKKSNGELHK